MSTIPRTISEVTTVWLTDVLQSAALLQSAAVCAVRTESIGAVEGNLGVLARLHLTYDRPVPAAPRTIIAKLSTPDPELRKICARFRFYAREVRFYRELASMIQTRVPVCYHLDLDESGEYCVLLMEDLSPAVVGDQIAGCTLSEARLAVQGLARIAAAFWNSPQLETMKWAPSIQGPEQMDQAAYLSHWWPTCQERVGHFIATSIQQLARAYGTYMPQIGDAMGHAPQTLLHGDYRLDNLFFMPEHSPDALAVCDWQLLKTGPGACDLVYFIGGNIDVAARRRWEAELLHLYHETLLASGVENYPFAAFADHYRLAHFYQLNVIVEGGAMLDFSSERAARMYAVLSQRAEAMIQDHDIAGFLQRLI